MATTTPPAISGLPAAPDPNDRSTFNTRAYPWSVALPAFGVEVSAVASNVKANADDAMLSATAAAAQALTATLQAAASASSAITAGATAWVSGTTYAIGNARFSPINGQTYRRITAGAGTTDPSADATNWVVVNGLVNQSVSIPVNNLPAIRPTLDLDFANSQTVDPRITFTRASTATRTNSKGLIELVPAGVPRIDFDPVTGACKGLLIEEQRANLLTYSEAFDNAAWTKIRTTITANATTAPDGSLTADAIIEDATASSTHVVYAADYSATNTTITASVYVKSAGRQKFIFEISNFSTGFGGAVFDLSTGVVGAITNSGDYASTTATITSVGNGWYRCSITTTKGSFNSVNRFLIELHNGTSNFYTGDGTSGIFIWGAQLEAGAFPTSYIPTVASQVTRAADVAVMTGANFSSWYRQDEGSFVAEYQLGADSSGVGVVFVHNGTSDHVTSMRYSSGSQPQFQVLAGGVSQANLAPAGYSTPGAYKRAVAYAVNSFNQAINGVLPSAEDTPGSLPTVTQMNIGSESSASANQLNGHIRSLSYYPKRCSNAELQALSTQ